MLRHFLCARCAGQVSFRHRALQIEDAQRVAAKCFVNALQLGKRELVQRLGEVLRHGHHFTDDVMRRPERHAFAHEIIRQVGRQQRRVARGGGAGRAIDLRVGQHRGHEPRRGTHGVGGVEQPFLVLLQIAIVGHRQSFQQREQRHQVAKDAAGLAAREFGDVGIFLLRHERRAGGVGVGDLDEIEFRPGPENHVLRESRKMHGEQRAGGAEFDGEIAVAHGVHGILRELNLAVGIHEAEQFGDEHAVQRERGTGDRAAAERADVHARVAVPEPFAIAFEHLDVGQQMVCKIDGLGALQVRVTGNDDVGILLAKGDKDALQPGDFAEERGDFIAQPEPRVEGDLVVARAGSVEFRAGGNPFGQLRFDVHVDVLEFGLPLELAGGDLLADLIQASGDGAQFVSI